MFQNFSLKLRRQFVPMKLVCTCLICVVLAFCSGCPPSSGPAPGPFIYVADFGNSSVTAYPLQASGNATPFKTYQGTSTQLAAPTSVAVDSNRTLYVANQGTSSVTEYALSNGGNVGPTATIQGSATGLNSPRAIAVASNGNIFVANFNANSVTVYGPTGPPNRAPIYTVTAGVSHPVGVTIIGIFLWILNTGTPPSITGYTGQGANGVAPLATITSSQLQNPQGLGTDGSGWLYVSNFDTNSVAVFLSFVQGNVNTTPWALIQGGDTGLQGPEGVAFDANGTLYVANRRGSSGFGSITFYSGFSPPAVGPASNPNPQDLSPGTAQGAGTQLVHIIGLTIG
jgi:6-phosphogluconolactonase (cycloisomerase 2 family)